MSAGLDGRAALVTGAASGIGHMITDSQALLATDQIIFGIGVIGLIGLVSDVAFKRLNQRLFRWASL
jgi:NitT/TauT family transport system permease protein